MQWMRGAAGLIGAVIVACKTPTQPISPVGMWNLVAVDGAVLPAALRWRTVAESGTIELKADNTYVEHTLAREDGVPADFHVRGTWRIEGDMVQLLDREVGLPYVARWSRSDLEVRGEHKMRYSR